MRSHHYSTPHGTDAPTTESDIAQTASIPTSTEWYIALVACLAPTTEIYIAQTACVPTTTQHHMAQTACVAPTTESDIAQTACTPTSTGTLPCLHDVMN